MHCDKCGRDVVISQRYSGLRLCRGHFIADFEAKAKRAIRTHGWLSRGDHIGIVLDGRGAGLALLHFLHKLTGRRRDITLTAIVAADGDGAGEQPGGLHGTSLQLPAGISCITASFSSEFLSPLPGPAGMEDDGAPHQKILSQVILYRTARRHGITKLAIAAGLCDEARLVLVQVLYGRPDLLLRLPGGEGPVVTIRPFLYASRQEIALYSQLAAGCTPTHSPGDAHADPFTADAGAFLDAYAERHPSAPYALVSLGEQLAAPGMPVREGVRLCEECGEPYTGTCQTCRWIAEVHAHG